MKTMGYMTAYLTDAFYGCSRFYYIGIVYYKALYLIIGLTMLLGYPYKLHSHAVKQ